MATLGDNLSVYRELADHYDRLNQVSMRDRFLMLAADAALAAGQADEAEQLRQRLLATSRHHMLRPYTSFAEAARSADVQTYLANLKANYPLAQARNLLETLRGQEGGAPPPAQAPIPRPIPPTAPVIDMNANARSARIDEPRPTYPLQSEEPRQAPRPRAQPAPAPAARHPAPNPIPVAAPAPPRKPVPPPQPRPSYDPPQQPEGGGGFGVVLAVLAGLIAVAAAVWALGQPYLAGLLQ